MLAGPKELIDEGRLHRKRLGGGMRQVGVLAAAGLIALEEMPKRLGEDHENAKLLAQGLAATPGIQACRGKRTQTLSCSMFRDRADGRASQLVAARPGRADQPDRHVENARGDAL